MRAMRRKAATIDPTETPAWKRGDWVIGVAGTEVGVDVGFDVVVTLAVIVRKAEVERSELDGEDATSIV